MKNALAVLALFFSVASASAMTGNDILESLQSSDVAIKTMSHFYIAGVFDGENDALAAEAERMIASKNNIERSKFSRPYFCSPANVKWNQLFDLVQKKLESEPENRHQIASKLVREAFINAWPCAGNP